MNDLDDETMTESEMVDKAMAARDEVLRELQEKLDAARSRIVSILKTASDFSGRHFVATSEDRFYDVDPQDLAEFDMALLKFANEIDDGESKAKDKA
jgi:hypothetical protein